jgi:RND family efflux transporter MFP subunit
MKARDLIRVVFACVALTLVTGCDWPKAHAEDEAPVASPTPRTAMRVRVAPAVEGSAAGVSNVTGVTSAFRHATISAEVAGRVVERHVEPGRVVKQGDPLVSLDATQATIALEEARANVAARRADLSDAERQRDRGDVLRKSDTMSERQHDSLRFGLDRSRAEISLAQAALRRAQKALDDAVVRAPFDGTVEEVSVQVGDYLAPGTPVSMLVDFTRVRVRAGVTANEADTLLPGMKARLSVPALGGLERDVEVQSVGKLADAKTGTYPVELWLDNEDGRLRAGMVAQVHFAAPEDEATGPLVPRGALVRRSGQLVLFVVEGSGDSLHAAKRSVQLGRQIGDQIEILGGIAAGERVVIDGVFALRDGAAVVIDGDAA